MEERVPGGRQRSETMDEFPQDEDEDGGFAGVKLSQQHRHVSQSLPRFSSDPRKLDSLPGDDTGRPHTLDRKRKYRSGSFRATFGSLMTRMVRHVSQLSLNSSPKSGKRRSLSLGPGDSRRSHAPAGDHAPSSSSSSSPITSNSTPLKFDKNKIPGILGIRNHGNTCFMNAVLQCLIHTDLLAEYFVTDQYKHDMKRNNKINAKKYGTRGELTDHLALLLKSLWSGQYTAEISSDFKSVVGKYGSQYRGFAQHDAQEFLLWLLDKVHEDLNIATKKKYRANKSSHGRPDEAVAAEALANHMRCNNSFVYDLFQALYRSSLICPGCHRQSNTFDPFLSVSLPIPQKTRRPVYVTVVYLDAQPRQVRIGLLLSQADTVRDLRHTLAQDTKIPVSQLLLTEIYYDGFHRTFEDSCPLGDIHETDNIYAIETPTPLVDTSQGNQYLASRYLLILLLNKQGVGSQGRRFGYPLVLQVPRDTTFLDLQNDILHNMTPMLRDGIIAQKMGVLFRLRVVDGLVGKCYLPHDVEHPLYMPTVDRALSIHSSESGPQHLKLLVEWDQQTKQCMIANSEDVVEEHASVQQVKLAHQQPILGTLDECFQLYTQEEKLGADDAWHCPNCRRRQQGTIKSLSLWSLPDIFVIHLKRFKQIGLRRTKLNTLITFPVRGLDMSQHVAKRSHVTHHHSNHLSPWSPWRRNKMMEHGPEDHVYDLYAVCNHYGNMQGGHYTAFCRNPADDNWYVYDDTQVKETTEDQIVTRAAYLLFYHRRTVHNSVARNNTWVYSITNLNYTPRNVPASKSHEDLLENGETDDFEEEDSNFSRSTNPYATMRTTSRTRCPSVPTTPVDPNMSLPSSQSMGQLDVGPVHIPPTLTRRAMSQDNPEVASLSASEISSPSSSSQTTSSGGPPSRYPPVTASAAPQTPSTPRSGGSPATTAKPVAGPSPDSLLLTEIYYDGFHRTFEDSCPLGDIHETDNIYAIETLTPLVDTSHGNQYLASRYLLILLLNKQGVGSQGRRFGYPLVLQVPRDTTFLDLQNDILHNMTPMLRDGIIAQRLMQFSLKKMGVLFRLRVVDGLVGKCYLPHDVEHPLYMPTVDRALSIHSSESGPQHLKLLVEWDQQTKQCMIANSEDVVEEHASVQQVKLAHQQPILGTLDECFQLYTQEEKLGADDAWHCPNCRRRQQGTIKSLSLWSLPDIFVIHLKRFKQIGLRRTKLNTLITFPVRGLDMSQHVAKRSHVTHHHSNHLSPWSPWRRNKMMEHGPEDHVYDLYAVCNHYGNMQGGHYTAFCRNPADDNWYVYDDTQVKETTEDQIVTRAAYLLFYHRRTVHNSVARNNTWVYSITNLNYTPRNVPASKSHEDLLENGETDDFEEEDSNFSRSTNPYATMRTTSRTRCPSVPTTPVDPNMSLPSSQSMGQLDVGPVHIPPTLTRRAMSQDNPEVTSLSASEISSPSSSSQTTSSGGPPSRYPPVTASAAPQTPSTPRSGGSPATTAKPVAVPSPDSVSRYPIASIPPPSSSRHGTPVRTAGAAPNVSPSQMHNGPIPEGEEGAETKSADGETEEDLPNYNYQNTWCMKESCV